MLVDKYFLVVTLIIFTSTTAQSFILLTANVADIKKIAQKFVSEELADKLAHSVVKVIDNLNNKKDTNIDDEINKLEISTEKFKNEYSDRNGVFNNHRGDQQRFKKATRDPDEEFTFNDSQGDTQSTYKVKNRKTTKYLNNWEMHVKSQDKAKYISKEEAIQPINAEIKSNYEKRPRLYETRTSKKPILNTIRTTRHKYQNYESNEVKSRYVPDLKPILDPESAKNQQMLHDNNHSSDRQRQKKRNRYQLMSGEDDINTNKNKRQSDEKKENLETWDNKETLDATTKKEKIEFDQYDNLNYPKMEGYIATSGPVALPAMPVEKEWWQKDFPNRRKSNK